MPYVVAEAAVVQYAPVAPQPSGKPVAIKKPVKPAAPLAHPAHRWRKDAKPARAGLSVLVLAGCYGRFIAWRDELSGLMLQANSYTPWPDDRIRFDRMERAFAAGARRDRNLVLTLQPAFHEEDFPPDIRVAFRAGLKESEGAFADNGYRHTQIVVVGQTGLSPEQRMAQLEANADQALAPLATPCEHVIGF